MANPHLILRTITELQRVLLLQLRPKDNLDKPGFLKINDLLIGEANHAALKVIALAIIRAYYTAIISDSKPPLIDKLADAVSVLYQWIYVNVSEAVPAHTNVTEVVPAHTNINEAVPVHTNITEAVPAHTNSPISSLLAFELLSSWLHRESMFYENDELKKKEVVNLGIGPSNESKSKEISVSNGPIIKGVESLHQPKTQESEWANQPKTLGLNPSSREFNPNLFDLKSSFNTDANSL